MLQVGQELSPEEVVAMKRDEETTSLSTFLATPMGKVMSSGGPEYTPEEVVTMQAADAKAEIPAEQVLVQQVAELNDPNAPDQTKDEWRRRTQLKKSLQEQGLLDSDFMATTKGVGGLVMTIADGVTSPLRYDPRDENGNVIPAEGALEYISRYNPATWPAAQADAALRLPATLNYAGELLEQGYGIMGDGLAGMGGPRYKVKETGNFITEMDRAMYRAKVAQTGGLAGDPSDDALIKQYAAQGMTLEPVTPEDVEEFEYQQHLRFRGRLKSMEQKRTEGAGAEVLTASAMSLSAAPLDWMTGSNYMDQVWGKRLPAESQAMAMQMGADPLVWTSFGAGLTRLGVSTAAKGGGARILDAIGKGAQKMARPTEQSLREVQRFQNAVWSKGRVAIYAGGLAGMNYSSLPEPLKNAMNVAAAAYVIHKGGAGTLRWVGDKFPQAAIMLREAADPLNGADIMARQAIAKNAKIPASIRERVARPSQFVSMESTPARLARNEALSPKTRKMMERLSNFYVVQGVRGASAVATGATKGAIAAVPFAELTRGGGDEEGANLIYGAGTALGGTGGAASRVFGARNRTVARAESDIGRMLVDIQGAVPELQRQGSVKRNQWFDRELNRFLTDVELAGGDIAHMFQARSFDEIARTAAMQGMFRNVDYVPLNDTDFALNAKAHGQSGAAGFYLHNPDGARPRLFVNLDARRADVDAHEFGEAFFSSDAFSPEQKAAMRAEVDARYGTDGVTARAREYAEQMIKSENARNFPNETLVVSDEQIRAKMDELAQDELGRGGQDPADWARREIMVEEWRMAGTDYARLRRGVPAGANPVTFVENILGANARALGLSGVRIDPETGQAVTPNQLFKENPVAADDPIVNRNLRAYIKTYNAWLNDPSQEAPSGVKVARDGNVQSFANNPNVDFYSSDPKNPTAPRENTFAVLGPDGRVIEKSPKQRRDERKARNTQVKNMAGRNLLAPGDAAFGLKRRADGRVVASGRRLPQSIILQNHWKPWLPIINMLETMADSNESMQVRYFAAGNSADKVKTAKPTDVVAINREMVFDQWTTNKDGDLLAQFLDLTSMRNRAMRAIGERNPALDPANGGPGYSLQAIMDDVNQWMADKRAGKAGEATIGPDRKNIVNALINPGTTVNRGKNPLAGSMGKGSAIKTLILEGINAVSGTGRKGAAMDYNWANGNFMPDQPPPRPDVDIDLPQERMPSALPQAGMAMPDAPVRGERADIPLNPRARQAAFISDRGEVRATGRATHFETNEDLGPDFLAIGAGHLGEDGFFRFGSQSMDEAMGDSPATSSAAAARFNQSAYDQGRRPSSMLEEPPGLERPAGRGQTGQAMPDSGDTAQPRRYVSMEKFIEEAGDDLGEVLPNAYANIEFNDNDYPTHLVSFADARNSMYRSRVPSKQFFDWLHSDEVMDGLVFDKEYTPARPGEGAGHTRESYQALIDRLREISLKPSKQGATGGARGQAMPDITITPDEARAKGLVGPVYHGSPDFKGRKFDPKYRARSSGISRGGFSFSDDVASADGYAGAGVDSAQAAVDAANDVMRDLGARMESGLKLREFADVSELPEFNVRYADDMDDLASYFNDLSKRIPKDLAARLRDAAKQVNEPANPVVVEAYLRNPKEMMIDGKRLLVADNPDDIFVSAARPPQGAQTSGARGQAMPDASQPMRGQAMADVGSAADDPPRRLIDMPQSALKVLHANSAELPKPAKKLTNATVALTLADVAEKHNNGIITSSNITPEQKSDLMILGADEAEAALKASGKNAGNWYSVAIEAALGIAGVIYRELSDAVAARSHAVLAKETDPVKAGQFALRLPLAITSQNMTVKLNTRASNEQFNIFLKTGKFDPSIAYGEKAKSISGNLDLANVMIDELGSVLALEDFVSRTFTVRELEAEASSIAGRKITIAGRKDDIVNGAAIFGPKIGQGFLQNLMGKFDPVTIDLWMRRTWGRWTGDVVGDGVTAQRLARLVDQSRKSGRKLPDSIKRLRTTMRSMGETKTGKAKKPELTMSEDVEARLEAETAFRKDVEAFAKEVNAEFQGMYKMMSDVMSPALAKKVQDAIERSDRLPDQADAILSDVYNAVIREQSRVKQQLDKKWSALPLEKKKEIAAKQLPEWANVEPKDRAQFIKKTKPVLKGDWLEMQNQAEGRTAKLGNPQKNLIKPAWANAAKSIVSELNPIDIPSDMDRRVITEVVNGIREELERRGYTVTNADVQAILWYPEKDLWAKLRGEEESILKQSYDDEFINIAEGLGLGLEARKVAKQIRGY